MTGRLTAMVLMLCAGAAAGADLGRLFFTPAQRATLDNARKQNISIEVGNDDNKAAAPVPQSVSVDGVVTRSDGNNTVWLNNRAVSGRNAGGLSIAAGKGDGRVRLGVPESGRSVDMKVGQSVEIVSGTITESYSRRAVPKSELQKGSAAGTAPVTAEKVAPPQRASPPGPADKAQERDARNKESDAKQELRRDDAPKK